MKVGDLVELSAYAKNVRAFHSLLGRIGIITEISNPSSIHELYFVHWTDGQETMFNRNELRFVKNKSKGRANE